MEKRRYRYEHGGSHSDEMTPDQKADKMKSDILSALRGGATDEEIQAMIERSGLSETHDIQYDNVEMTASVRPKMGGRERQIGREVMSEGTMGASRVENLLEKLMDEGRRRR